MSLSRLFVAGFALSELVASDWGCSGFCVSGKLVLVAVAVAAVAAPAATAPPLTDPLTKLAFKLAFTNPFGTKLGF